MNLGIIAWYDNEEQYRSARENGIESLEFDINDNENVPDFTSKLPQIKKWLKKYKLSVAAIGQWGTERVLPDESVNREQIEVEKELMRGAAELGCGVYICGCNRSGAARRDLERDFNNAINYLKILVEYGKELGIKVCLYNCNWNNFLDSHRAWEYVLNAIPELGIKFDPSHPILHGRDWKEEMRNWAHRFYHVHIKGTLYLGNGEWDFPPAGLDDFDWRVFFGYLYAAGYDGCVALEPHSAVWQGELGEKGVAFSAKYIKSLIV